MNRFILAVLILIVLAVANTGLADSILFDFDSGIGPDFSVLNSGDLYSIDTDGPTVRISKAADDGIFAPQGFISGGIRSNFTIDGDFAVTIDFELINLPYPDANQQLNESLLAVGSDNGPFFEVLRFKLNGRDRVEVYSVPPGGALGAAETNALSGQYRITRSGSTMSGLFAPTGTSDFTLLAQVEGFTGPFWVQAFAAQGTNVAGGPRSTTALDVAFDNLVIEADRIDGVVPEPSTLVAFAGLGVIGLLTEWRRHRRKTARAS